MAGSKFIPRKRQERGERRMAAVVGTAAGLFAAHGFDGTSMSLIAQDSGMSLGSLYQYFPHKEAIIDAVAEDYLRLWRAHKEVILATVEALPLRQAMSRSIELMVEFHERHWGIRAFLDADRNRAESIAAVQAEVDFAVPLPARFYPSEPLADLQRSMCVVASLVRGIAAPLAAERDPLAREASIEEYTTACYGYLVARLGEPLVPGMCEAG